MLFQMFQPSLKPVSINSGSTEPKAQFFHSRTQKISTNPNNQKQFIPKKHNLSLTLGLDRTDGAQWGQLRQGQAALFSPPEGKVISTTNMTL